jgi:hypothetical protein
LRSVPATRWASGCSPPPSQPPRESEATAGYRFANLNEAADWQVAHAGGQRTVVASASNGRAIFPAFDGTESHDIAPVDLRERWATVTILRAERRPWLVEGRGFIDPIDAANATQWPVTAIVIPE